VWTTLRGVFARMIILEAATVQHHNMHPWSSEPFSTPVAVTTRQLTSTQLEQAVTVKHHPSVTLPASAKRSLIAAAGSDSASAARRPGTQPVSVSKGPVITLLPATLAPTAPRSRKTAELGRHRSIRRAVHQSAFVIRSTLYNIYNQHKTPRKNQQTCLHQLSILDICFT
jgi:hypothetical protein